MMIVTASVDGTALTTKTALRAAVKAQYNGGARITINSAAWVDRGALVPHLPMTGVKVMADKRTKYGTVELTEIAFLWATEDGWKVA